MIITIILILVVCQTIMTAIYARLMKKIFNDKIRTNSLGDFREKKEIKKVNLKKRVKNWIDSWIRFKLFILSYFPSHAIRKFVLKTVYNMSLKRETVIYYGFEIREPWNISIGKSVIGDKCVLDGRMGIEIGDNVNISSNVQIWTLQHSVNDPLFRCLNEGGKVTVGDRVWLSSNTTVLPGIHIGEGAVIGSGCIVTKDIESFSINVGIPAKKVGDRNRQLEYEMNGSHYHFL